MFLMTLSYSFAVLIVWLLFSKSISVSAEYRPGAISVLFFCIYVFVFFVSQTSTSLFVIEVSQGSGAFCSAKNSPTVIG